MDARFDSTTPRNPTGKVRIVPTVGWTPPQQFFYVAAIVSLAIAGLVVLFAVWASKQQYRNPIPLGFALPLSFGLFGTLAAVFISVAWIQTPRAIELSDHGVGFLYPLRRVELPWAEIMRAPIVTWGTVTFYPNSIDPAKVVGGAYRVSFAQAQAMLSDLCCPHVNLTDAQRHSLRGA